MPPFAIPAILGSPVARYLITGVVFTSVLVGGYFYIGSRFTTDCKRDYEAAARAESIERAAEEEAARAESIERAAEEARKIALQDAEIINWSDNVRAKPVFVPIWKEHENTAYADCTLTPAQRVLYNRATRLATDISDSSLEAGSGDGTDSPGDGVDEGDGSAASEAHAGGASTGYRPGSGQENVGSAWVVGGGY
jgi:hypothetical protein